MSDFPNGFAQGVTIRGLPLTVAHPGKVFWVNGTTVLADKGIGGSNGNPGTYTKPFATIDYAVGRCTSGRGDIIMVMPGHTETISSATSLVLDVDGVAVIGLGSGNDRPTLTYSATAGTVEIDNDNITLYNLRFLASVSAVVVGVNVDGDFATIDNCEFNFEATGDDFVTTIDADTVTGFSLTNSRLIAEDAAGNAEMVRLDTAHQTVIAGNYFYGAFSDGAIIGEGAASTNLLIADNYVYNSDTTGGEGIDLNVACTGVITNNRLGTLFPTAPETTFDPGSCLCTENYVVNAIDESGIIVPTTLST